MKKYYVNVHYVGGCGFEIEAPTEDEAKEIALGMFGDLSSDEICQNLGDCFVDDSWDIS